MGKLQTPPTLPDMTAADSLRHHRTEILRIARQYGATDVRLFGSVARTEADAPSDIDLLVRMEPGRSLFDLGGLLMDLAGLLGRRVDIITDRGMGPRMREHVLRDAVPS
jgi:predicted nucleotidyltransferase